MAKKHERFLQKMFHNNSNVYTSTELIDEICIEFKECSRDNARKIIEISVKNGIINSIKELNLTKNRKIYYSNSIELSYELIKDILRKERPSLYRVLERLNENKGVISYIEIAKLSSTTIKKSTTNVQTFKEILIFLKNNNIKKLKDETYRNVKYLVDETLDNIELRELMIENYNKIKLECIFLAIFLIWLQKHRIITIKNSVLYRNKLTPSDAIIHNNLAWDAIGYTTTTGLSEYIGNNKDNKTLVVLDIKINDDYNILDLHGFYDRIQIHRNSVKNKKNKRSIFPIVIASNITKEAFAELYCLNIIYFGLGTVYGEGIFEIIQRLKLLNISNVYDVNNLDDNVDDEKEKLYLENIKSILEKIEVIGQGVNLYNIRGTLFEQIIYIVLYKIFPNALIIPNYIFNDNEYDFYIQTDTEYIIVEVKGWQSNNKIKKGTFNVETKKYEKNTITWFFRKQYPLIKKHLKMHNPFSYEMKISACYITVGYFESDALDVLEEYNISRDKPTQLDIYYDRKKLMKLLEDRYLYDEKKLIEKYFK